MLTIPVNDPGFGDECVFSAATASEHLRGFPTIAIAPLIHIIPTRFETHLRMRLRRLPPAF